jgi:hypothetical protein
MFTTEWKLNKTYKLTEREKSNLDALNNLKNKIERCTKDVYTESSLSTSIDIVFGHDNDERKKSIYNSKIEELNALWSTRPKDINHLQCLEYKRRFKDIFERTKNAQSIDDINLDEFLSIKKVYNNECIDLNTLLKHIETLIKYHSLYHTLQNYIDTFKVSEKLIEYFKSKFSEPINIDSILIKKYKMPSLKDVICVYTDTYTNYGDNIIEEARKELILLIKQVLNIDEYKVLMINDVNVEVLTQFKGSPTYITRGIEKLYTLNVIKNENENFMNSYKEAMAYKVD